jgi:hypothetical protein
MSWGDEPPPFDKMPPGKWGGPVPSDPGAAVAPSLGVVVEAWRAFQSRMGAWVLALAATLILETIILWAASKVVGEDFVRVIGRAFRAIVPSWRHGLVYLIAAAMINGFFMGGLLRMAIRQWRGQPFSVATMFGLGDVLGPLVRTWVLYVLAVSLGLSFCIVPGLVIAAVFMFAVPLVLDGERSALGALRGSMSLVRGQVVGMTAVHTVAWLLFLLGGALCLAGLIVAWPVYVLTIARLYTERVGGSSIGPSTPAKDPEPTTYL